MTPVHNPSLPPVQIAAGEPVDMALLAEQQAAFDKWWPQWRHLCPDRAGACVAFVAGMDAERSTAPTTGSAPFNPDDCKGYWIQGGVKHYVGYPIVADPQLVDLNKGDQSPEQVAPPANAPVASEGNENE